MLDHRLLISIDIYWHLLISTDGWPSCLHDLGTHLHRWCFLNVYCSSLKGPEVGWNPLGAVGKHLQIIEHLGERTFHTIPIIDILVIFCIYYIGIDLRRYFIVTYDHRVFHPWCRDRRNDRGCHHLCWKMSSGPGRRLWGLPQASSTGWWQSSGNSWGRASGYPKQRIQNKHEHIRNEMCNLYIIDLIFSPSFWLTIPDFTLTLVLSVVSCLQNMATLAFSFSMVFAVGPVQNPSIVEYSPDLYACSIWDFIWFYMHILLYDSMMLLEALQVLDDCSWLATKWPNTDLWQLLPVPKKKRHKLNLFSCILLNRIATSFRK